MFSKDGNLSTPFSITDFMIKAVSLGAFLTCSFNLYDGSEYNKARTPVT